MSLLDKEIIQSWTAEELIKEVYHELNQKTALTLSAATLLADENSYGFISDEQKKLVLMLKDELEIVRAVTEWLGIWKDGN